MGCEAGSVDSTRAGHGRPSWKPVWPERLAGQLGRPRGEDSWEVQGTTAWASRRAAGAAAGPNEGCAWAAGGPRGGKAAENLCTAMGVLSPDTRVSELDGELGRSRDGDEEGHDAPLRTRVKAGSASDMRGSRERRPAGCGTRLPDSTAIWEAGALRATQTPSTRGLCGGGKATSGQSHFYHLLLLPSRSQACSDTRMDTDLHLSVGGAPRK